MFGAGAHDSEDSNPNIQNIKQPQAIPKPDISVSNRMKRMQILGIVQVGNTKTGK